MIRFKMTVVFLFAGTCYTDKLKKAIVTITAKRSKTSALITKFQACKQSLKKVIARNVVPASKFYPKYDECTINIDCKLKNLLTMLADKKLLLQRELKAELSGFGKEKN